MNFEKKHMFRALCALVVGGTFCLANPSVGEEYDEDTYGPEADFVYETPAKAIFSHKFHVREAENSCEDCHDGAGFEMEQGAAAEAGDFTMKSFAEGKYCGTCHEDTSATLRR